MRTVLATVDKTLRERIIEATQASLRDRDLYTEKVVAKTLDVLQRAEKEVKSSLLRYANLGSLSGDKVINRISLQKLLLQIQDSIKMVRSENTLILRTATIESYKSGIYKGISDLVMARLPFYGDLTPEGIKQCGSNIFTLIDRNALDFMANYNVQLAGDVSRELLDGINRAIQTGIASGKSAYDVAKDIGRVVRDPEEFRRAGKTVFKSAQYRMEMIARTETLRAHNQGSLKFYNTAGVQKVEWLAAEDERMCPVCGDLDGQIFPMNDFPNIPAHSNCRCSTLPYLDGAEVFSPEGVNVGAEASLNVVATRLVILSPGQIEQMVKDKRSEAVKVGQYISRGEWDKLSFKQLREQAKRKGISVSRTKEDLMHFLKEKSGLDYSTLSGKDLIGVVQEHGISRVRDKDELIRLLKASLKREEMPDYDSMTVIRLREISKEKGVSHYLTKLELIDVLNRLEPGIDHSRLAVDELIEARQRFNIPAPRTKEELVRALERQFKEDLKRRNT